MVADLVRDRGLWLIYDAAMERILYNGRTVLHPASLPGMAEHVITVGSASKELRMIGWRVGWIVAPERIMPDLALVSMANVAVPVGIAQEAVAAALELGDQDVALAVAEWQRRRDALLTELDGLPVIRPALVWCPLPMLPLSYGETRSEHFSLDLSPESGGRGKNVLGAMGGLRIQDAKPRRLCGGRPGLLSLADDARCGEPTIE